MKRLLYIAHRVPYPPDKGERVRAFHEIKALSERFHVTLAALAHNEQDFASASPLGEICDKVLLAHAGGKLGLIRGAWSMLTGGSVTEGYFRSSAMADLIRDTAAGEPFDVVMAYCSSVLRLSLSVPAKAHLIDLVDVDSVKWADYAESATWPKSLIFSRESKTVARLERQAVECCDAVMLVSEAEAGMLTCGGDNVTALSNGVNVEYFRPNAVEPCDLGPAAMVFTGTMDYRPNIEGVCWFVREVWSDLKKQIPDATFTIVGRDPVAVVRQLDSVDGVRVTGSVADVRPFLAGAGLTICPLQIARGIQNKVLEAMAMGKAMVASTGAIEGIEADVGTHLLRADTPLQWREHIVNLLTDKQKCQRIGRNASQHILEKYTWPARMAPLVNLCEKFADKKRHNDKC